MSTRVRWSAQKDRQGYWTTTDGRWKAAPKGEAVTLTDTTRRAVFAATGQSWIRLPDWPAVSETIAAHARAEKR